MQSCCDHLLEATRRDYYPAQMVYRRIVEALSSICSYDNNLFNEPLSPLPLELETIEPTIFRQLQKLEDSHPQNFLSQLIRYTEQVYLSKAVYEQIRQINGSTDEVPDFLSAVSPESFAPVINQDAEAFLFTQLCALSENLETRSTAPAELDLKSVSLTLAAAILFDEPGSGLLENIFSLIKSLTSSLCFHLVLPLAGYGISPLELACRVGNASAVRTLSRQAGEERIALTRWQGEHGTTPLHFLFTFPDSVTDEMCALLLDEWQSHYMHRAAFYPQLRACQLYGTPLDFNLKVGSLSATRALWEQAYLTRDPCLSNFSEFSDGDPYMSPRNPMEKAAGKFFSSMNPAIWEYFVHKASEGTKGVCTYRDLCSPDDVGTSRERALLVVEDALRRVAEISTIPLMICHGPNYWDALQRHMQIGTDFFGAIWPINLSFYQKLPDIGIQLALLESIKGQSLSILPESMQPEYCVEGEFADSAHSSQLNWHGILKQMFFREAVRQKEQGFLFSHSLGFIMYDCPDQKLIIDALIAAAMVHDFPAFRRIIRNEIKYGHNLNNNGAAASLGRAFVKKCPPQAEQYLQLVLDMDSPIFESLFDRLFHYLRAPDFYGESTLTETGTVLWDAIKYDNLELVLALVKLFPAILTPRLSHPSLFHLICANDSHHALLEGLLERLDPSQSITSLKLRERGSGMSAVDVGAIFASQQCLRHIGRFLDSEDISWKHIYSPNSTRENRLVYYVQKPLLDISVGVELLRSRYNISGLGLWSRKWPEHIVWYRGMNASWKADSGLSRNKLWHSVEQSWKVEPGLYRNGQWQKEVFDDLDGWDR